MSPSPTHLLTCMIQNLDQLRYLHHKNCPQVSCLQGFQCSNFLLDYPVLINLIITNTKFYNLSRTTSIKLNHIVMNSKYVLVNLVLFKLRPQCNGYNRKWPSLLPNAVENVSIRKNSDVQIWLNDVVKLAVFFVSKKCI
jgi:hypothetical protein